MKAKAFLLSMVAAAAVMVGCNKDAEEVVMVSADAPNVNGTWVSVEDDAYKVEISGNKFTVTYPAAVYEYDTNNWGWDLTDKTTSATQVFEGGKIVTDTDGSNIKFVYDYTNVKLYANSSEKTTTMSGKSAAEFKYTKVGDYLMINWSDDNRTPSLYDCIDGTYYYTRSDAYLTEGAYKKVE